MSQEIPFAEPVMRIDVDEKVFLLDTGYKTKASFEYNGDKFGVKFTGELGKFYMSVNGEEKKLLEPMNEFKIGNVNFRIVAICTKQQMTEHGLDVALAPPLHMEMEYSVDQIKFSMEGNEVRRIGIGAEVFFKNNKFWYCTHEHGKGKNARICEPGHTFEQNGVKTKIIVIREIID